MRSSRRRARLLIGLGALGTLVLVLSILSVAGAVSLPLPIGGGSGSSSNDLTQIGPGMGQTPAKAPVQQNAEPPLTATPVESCGPGSHPEPGVDGRVPAGSGVNGLWCNMTEVSHQGTSGGFKTFRYVDSQGHVCAFYDTALLFPTNAINPGGPSLGVAVLDMSNPAHPVQTDTLSQPPMETPHESLNLNPARGLLAAVNGNPSTEPGLFSIYDVHADCRHPVLDATKLVAPFGHESGFSPDGKTFYATGTATPSITAIDVTNPKDPVAIWQGNIVAHGMTISDDGNRAYVADPTGGDMLILDTSQIQSRKPNPQAREVSRLTWKSASIPQNAIPFTENGHPYVLEFDEYTQGTINPSGSRDVVGAGRIIDISNESHPFVVSNLRLQVDQPAEHHAASNDPGTFNPTQGYAAHYCNIPTRVNPKIVACSFIASGLRAFDISDLQHPKELGYFVSPTTPNTETGYTESDFAMSQPTFDVARHDIWYTDGGTGFYVVHVASNAWPQATTTTTTRSSSSSSKCPAATGRVSKRSLGPARLGTSRNRVRRAFSHSLQRRHRNVDIFCLKGGNVTVAYPSNAVLGKLKANARKRDRGKAMVAVTSNKHYSLRGVHPGASFGTNRKRLHAGKGIRLGKSTWYLTAGANRGVIGVQHGKITQIGVADRSLTAKRAEAGRLLREL